MADGSIKIRIGAAADRSVDTVFGSIEKRAQKARDTIAKLFGSGGAGRGMQQLQSGAEKAMAGVTKAAEKSAQAQVKAQETASRNIQRVLAQQVRAAEQLDRQRARGLMQQHQQQEREARSSSRAMEQFANRTSHRATRFLFPPPTGMLSGARRIAGDIARGAGVDMSIGGAVGRAVSLNSNAVGLANQERIATGSTRGAAFYEGLARDTGSKFSQSPDKVMDMLRAFTGKTGNFQAASSMSNSLTSLSVASGSDLTEMGDAAGYVYNQLKNLPDAGARTIAVMRGIVGQTAVGAVEMKDYATQMGRVAANAGKFEGPLDQNILKLSALTQLNIESGGATSAADAARGTVAFTNTLGKSARMAAFKKAGVEIFADKAQTQHRDPFEILKDSFRATKGNIPQLAGMYADVLGRKSITALSGTYKAAGGGEAGIDAVSKALDKYMSAQLTAAAEEKNIADVQASAAAKAQRFQNELDKIVSVTANDLMPAFEAAAPVVLQVSKAFGGLISWATENPGKAILAAILGSIARAGMESAFRSAIDNLFKGQDSGGRGFGYGGTGTSKGTGGSAAGVLGAVGTGLAIGIPVAAAIYGEGISSFDENSKSLGGLSKGLANSHGKQLQFDLLDAKNQLKTKEDEYGTYGSVKDFFGMGSSAEFNGVKDLIARKEKELAEFQKTGKDPEAERLKTLKDRPGGPPTNAMDPNALGTAVANGLGAKTLNVHITNAKDIGVGPTPPKVSPKGRGPEAGQ